MTKKIIRLGDPTDHGGQVTVSGAPHFTVDSIAVALKGDACNCPKHGHEDCTIAEGDPSHTINGTPVAYEGHKTTCGAMLQSTIDKYTRSRGSDQRCHGLSR
ncbi:MAG: PAAR domain-containing protein [Burkholderiales bacterium]|jgi:uncharacterized Zn-binding protein involved in type VI secretion|nr:PAAR domain-containing protein [Burkholderiales bacterium]